MLRRFKTIVYPNKTMKLGSLKTFSVTLFGFGQKEGQVNRVHPRYLLATLERGAYMQYRHRRAARQKKTYTRHNQALMTNTIFQAKDHAPYGGTDEINFFSTPTPWSLSTSNPPSSISSRPHLPTPSQRKSRKPQLPRPPSLDTLKRKQPLQAIAPALVKSLTYRRRISASGAN